MVRGGRAGNGSSENIGQSTAALTGVAPVASAAARRAKSTQTTPQGPALTPSQTSEVPSLRSGAERMTSTVFIDTVEIAVMHRSQQIESIEATSSAMSRQAASDVEIETRTVVVGTENVDLGSSQVVPEEGTGRSAGGGQSELSLVHPLKRQEYSQPSVAVDGDSSRSETRIESVMRSRETLEILAVSRTVEHLPQGEASSREMIRMVPANAGSVVRSNPTTVETDGAGPATVETRSVADGGIEPAVFIPHSTERISLMSEEAPGATGVHSPATFLERSKAGPPMLTAVKLPEGALAVTPLRQPMMSLPASDTQDVQRNLDEPVVVDVKIDVPDVKGPGGIRAEPNRKVGSMIRRASRDSELLAMTDVRFLVPDRTGAPSISGTEKVAAPAFSERLSRKQGSQNGANLTSMEVQIDEAIERGLGFLARHQASNGSWSLHQFAVGKPYQDAISDEAIDADTAATGLALLSFMGAGYHHREDMYQEVVRAAIEYLKRNQRSDGNLFVSEGPNANRSAALYSHAIASIALCEAYGMTLDSELKNSAQMALKYITQSQHLIRGGWRYQPNAGTDTSVSGWMMMALKSGQLANLEVPEETFAKIVDYLDLASTGQQPYLFAYNPYAPDTPQQRHGRRPSKTMTAVGLLMRLYSGWGRDYSDMVRGADYLLKHPPSFQDRDTYFWYYATQVMFHMGGEYWKKWNQQLYSLLRASQTIEGPLAGSWDPHNPVSDKWGKHAGRLYVTTMNLLSLEIRYRHLPIYEEVTGE